MNAPSNTTTDQPTLALTLKPCPFCGGEASVSEFITESKWSHADVIFTNVTCGTCDILFDSEPGEEPDAITAWNTRTNSEPRPDLREALEAFGALLATHDEDEGMDDFADDNSVGAYKDKDGTIHDLPLTFGILRRARRAYTALATHSPAPMAGEGKYLVWSNEHKAWWGVDHRGYTRFIERAGRYDRAEALKIAGTRDGGWRLNKGNPDEIALPEQDATEQYADITAAQAAAHPSTQEGGK